MTNISAQISIYPLGQTDLAPEINEVLSIFGKFNLGVSPGSMSTLITGELETVFEALKQAFQHTAEHGRVVMVSTLSNACPVQHATPQNYGNE